MEVINLFGPRMTAMLALVALTYFLLALAPVIWPAYRVYRSNPKLPRPWLFVLSVAAFTYGLFSFLAFAILLPVEVYSIYVAPTLAEANLANGAAVLAVSRFIADQWWLLIPPVQLALTWYVTRKLEPKWGSVCVALAA